MFIVSSACAERPRATPWPPDVRVKIARRPGRSRAAACRSPSPIAERADPIVVLPDTAVLPLDDRPDALRHRRPKLLPVDGLRDVIAALVIVENGRFVHPGGARLDVHPGAMEGAARRAAALGIASQHPDLPLEV